MDKRKRQERMCAEQIYIIALSNRRLYVLGINVDVIALQLQYSSCNKYNNKLHIILIIYLLQLIMKEQVIT